MLSLLGSGFSVNQAEAFQGRRFGSEQGFAQTCGLHEIKPGYQIFFLVFKAAFRSDEKGFVVPQLNLRDMRRIKIFKGSDDWNFLIPRSQLIRQFCKFVQGWNFQSFALLGSFRDLRPDSLCIDFSDLCTAGQNRVEVGNPQLNGLFNQKIEALLLDRRQKKVNAARLCRLGFRLLLKLYERLFFVQRCNFAQPLAIPAVKKPYEIAGF